MKEVEGYLASIVESSADAIMSIDLKGTITSWNKGAEDIFGYKAKEIVGKHYYVIVPKELRGETEELRKKVLKKGYIRNYETYRLHRDGRKIPVNLTISVIKDRDGKPIGTSGIFKDLSERKKLEQEIKETRDHFRNILNTIQEKICVID
ncbi:MAG: MEKHLA domain-containing protein, partial [Euryarchaeota archaeon]|nr:MEKHLA domain-containing protein [Euryarchaeota archaeon]